MNKEQLLQKLKDHIIYIRKKITNEKEKLLELQNKSPSNAKGLRPEDQVVFWNLKSEREKRQDELSHLSSSPYFMKCELQLEHSGEHVEYRFAKFQLSEESIYSWVAPIAAIRFNKPGPVSYRVPQGRQRKAILKEKEQYMIVDGKVVFFALESQNVPRQLIYQEHFSNRKSGFILPEIVAEMEQIQDQVIRAHHQGSMVISGPAGSGKTTLAFHRVAYIVQSPDTSALYPEKSIIIFVQDNGTKEYFSHLLPELGIKGVTITTFPEWKANRKTKSKTTYSLMVIDEFQNYVPEQLLFLKKYLDKETQSIIYVGDMAQQIIPGAITSWDQINETITPDKHVTLKKVYRNTKNILSYIKNLGYPITIPEGTKEGKDVSEVITLTISEEVSYIKNLIKENSNKTMGVLSQTSEQAEILKQQLPTQEQLHVLSIAQSQGVEFDIVCLVDIDHKTIPKDLLYIGLTRAISELHILSKEK